MANITINDTPTRVQYSASAAQTVFSYTFPIKADTDLQVYQYGSGDTPDDTTDLLTLTVDYTVTGANTAAGGTIILVAPANTGDIITILGAKPIDRTAIYDQSVTLSKADLNNDFNDNVMFEKQTQTLLEQITPAYMRDELVGNNVRPDKLKLPMLEAGQVWMGRGSLGATPDDIVAVDLSTGVDLAAEFVIGTADVTLPNAQVLGSLTEGILYNDVAAGTGTLYKLNVGTGLSLDLATKTLTASGTDGGQGAKFWLLANLSGTILASFNVTSVVATATTLTITLTVPFSSVNYAVMANVKPTGFAGGDVTIGTKTTSTVVLSSSGTVLEWNVCGFGAQ